MLNFKTLTGRLFKLVFGLYLGLAVVVTAVQLVLEYSTIRKLNASDLVSLGHSFGPGMGDALWTYDIPLLESLARGLLQTAIVTGVMVEGEHGEVFAAVGEVPTAKPVHNSGLMSEHQVHRIPLYSPEADSGPEKRVLGQMSLYSHREVVVDRVEYSLIIILINSLIKTAGLWLIFYWAISRRLSRPLVTITGAVSALDGADNKPVHIDYPHNDEVGQLVQALNATSQRLAATHQQLTEKVVALQDAENALTEANRDLELKVEMRTADLMVAKEAAEEASRAKSAFLRNMSHELRTPLNAIMGYAQLFSLNPDLPEEIKRQSGEIETAGKNLLTMVSNVLDLANIEAGKLELDIRAVAVRSLLLECMSLVGATAKRRGVELKPLSCEAQGQAVLADYQYLRQVFIHLLSNAIKYNRQNGSVHINCMQSDDKLRITVMDTGRGIALENQSLLFNGFERLGMEGGTIEGSGIGLVICKRLIETMGGSIGFESREGEGSHFWVELPATIADDVKSHATSRGGGPSTALQQAATPSVLYVEDNASNLQLMKDIFTVIRKDLEFRYATTAEVGLEMARAEPPSLILMDINLPGMDGFAALAQLKGFPETAEIPVVAVSGNAMPEDIELGMHSGFVKYVTKPFDIEVILELLDEWFGEYKE